MAQAESTAGNDGPIKLQPSESIPYMKHMLSYKAVGYSQVRCGGTLRRDLSPFGRCVITFTVEVPSQPCRRLGGGGGS